jgi:alpha-galactosidase/6-phospho-beta-glucosidase family protein
MKAAHCRPTWSAAGKAIPWWLDAVLHTGGSFVATDNREEAFTDADYFTITISTGGLPAMAHDLALPEEYGIFHTAGDACGPSHPTSTALPPVP